MPTVSAARGCSPTDRMRRPIGVRKRITCVRISSPNTIQIIRLSEPKTPPMPGIDSTAGRWTFGTESIDAGVPFEP